MRVISGSLKGKSIKYLKNLTTRPLKDAVKENIFNIIQHSKLINIKMEKSNILDLYSGFGSFGIECLSRGAERVVFIEYNKNTTNILKQNLIKHSIIDKTRIINDKIEESLKNLKNEKFNIFFLDPPFDEKYFIQNLYLIKKFKMVDENHIVIIHRERKTLDNLSKILKIIFIKSYGRSKIIFGSFN